MMQKQNLTGLWKIHWSDGQRGGYPHYLHMFNEPSNVTVMKQKKFIPDDYDDVKWLDAQVPGEIHLDLMRAGIIASPYNDVGILQCRWVEECLWYYRRVFDAPEACEVSHAELIFEGLDYGAVIYLNGEEIGRHSNAFYPCVINVTNNLLPYGNVLLVQLESGLFSVCEKPIKDYYTATMTVDVLLHKRNWLRKTQSQMAWDWAPRLMNIGIYKPVYLQYGEYLLVESTAVTADLNDDLDVGTVNVRVFISDFDTTLSDIDLIISIQGNTIKVRYDSIPDDGILTTQLTVMNPKLWWPSGYGKQPLYSIDISIYKNEVVLFSQSKRIGFRKIDVNKNRHPIEGCYFIFEINHIPIFIKGSNLVPADIITAAITDETYATLVELALEAGFNFLRIWGGGLYESDILYEICNKNGIMLWQEFVFACATTPMSDEILLDSIRKEVIYNIRRLSHNPSLVAWCGNNEVGDASSQLNGFMHTGEDNPLFDDIIPEILKKEAPILYYQPTSPYSEDGSCFSSAIIGDQHPWDVGFVNKDSRLYEKMVCRFPNEGGILGPSSLPTMKACLRPDDGIQSFSWQIHGNMLDSWMPGSSPRDDVLFWLGCDMRKMTLAEYTYAGGFVQGEGLKRYIENFHRRKYSSSGAVFWMYNDCWPTTGSWTIVDYYLHRTPSYFAVKRAFGNIVPIISLDDEKYSIFVVNDTLLAWCGTLHFGAFTTDGKYISEQRLPVVCNPNCSMEIAMIEASVINECGIDLTMVFACLYDENNVLVGRTRYTSLLYHELVLPPAVIRSEFSEDGMKYSCETLALGVCLGLDGTENLSDNMFDLFPGQSYFVKGDTTTPIFVLNNFLKGR